MSQPPSDDPRTKLRVLDAPPSHRVLDAPPLRTASPFDSPPPASPPTMQEDAKGPIAQGVSPPSDAETIRTLLASSLLHALRVNDPRAYFERIARTEPNLFYKYVALLCPQVAPRGAANAQSNVVNILAALPRTKLDELPEGFRLS